MRPRRTVAAIPSLLAMLALCACAAQSSQGAQLNVVPAPSATSTGTSAPYADDVAPPNMKPAVAFLGDSLTSGFYVDPSLAWPVTLSSSESWDGHNISCPGSGFVAIGSCGTYQDMVDPAIALHPSLVIIPASSNDLGEDPATIKNDMAMTLMSLRKALPGASIVGLSAIWNDGDAPSELGDISNDLKDALAKVGGTYIDIGEPVYGHPEWVQLDTVHYTQEGYDAVARAVGASLMLAKVRP